MTIDDPMRLTLLLGGSRGEVSVATGGGERTTVSWPQCGTTFSLAYQESVDRTTRQFDMSTRLLAPEALDEALNVIREILKANGFDRQPTELSLTALSGREHVTRSAAAHFTRR